MDDMIERYEGTDVTVLIHPHRCIHSRNCVMGRPDVFVPNAEGPWIHPDAAPAEEVIAIARSCPSGAIAYERHDGGLPETGPVVNTIRLRENGPLALNADLAIAGGGASLRATLCRCGASRNKPYCDGSHHDSGFVATGEPETRRSKALDVRNEPLTVTPTPNGPLMVSGSLEILSGTGRTIDRLETAFLCRCGASASKPFCDGSHKRVGFTDQP